MILDCVLEKSEARILDQALGSVYQGRDVCISARETGIHIQSVDANRTTIVDFLIKESMFSLYKLREACTFGAPNLSFYRRDMKAVRITVSGTKIKMCWELFDVTMKKEVYVANADARSVGFSPADSFSLCRRTFCEAMGKLRGAREVYFRIEGGHLLLASFDPGRTPAEISPETHPGPVDVCIRIPVSSRAKSSFSVPYSVLRKTMIGEALYDRLSLSVGEAGEPMSIVCESLGYVSSATVATAVL